MDFDCPSGPRRDIAGRLDQVADELAGALTAAGPDVLADPGGEGPRPRRRRRVRHPALIETSLGSDDLADIDTKDVAAVRALVDRLVAGHEQIGRLAMEIAPGYLSEAQAIRHGLARFADDMGIELYELLADRRYALSGDRRALDGVL